MKRTFTALLALIALVSNLSIAFGQSDPDSTTPWTVDDVIMSEGASGFQISLDSRWVVWVRSVGDRDKDARVSNLVLSSLTERREIQLTRGSVSSLSPRWSPDGQLIAFITTRPDPSAKPKPTSESDGPKPQIWLINPFGGEPWPLTHSDRGIRALAWADADTIIFNAQEDPSLYELNTKEKKDTSVVVEDEENEPPVRLFRLSVADKRVTRLTDNPDRIRSFFLSPDGSHAVAIHDRSLRYVFDQEVKPTYFLHDLAAGKAVQIFADRVFNIGQAVWRNDGKGFYATSAFTNHSKYVNATITELHYFDLETRRHRKVNLEWKNGLEGSLQVTEDGFIALLADGARHRPARYRMDGESWKREWINGEHDKNIFGMVLGRDGKMLVYSYTTAGTPIQWFRASLDGNRKDSPVQFTELNKHFKTRSLSRTEVIRWTGALDEEVEGILYYPTDYESGKRYPLVVMIHGGPAGVDLDAWSDSWAYPHHLVTQRGAFVLKPNYHGSSNYGLEWVESISDGKYYELEVPDIEKGVDHLIDRGLVDPDRLGALGWSNGAILTTALTVNSTRYKVASAGAGNVEWASDWSNAHFGAAFDNYYLGKSPFEDPMLYIDKSPYYRLDRVRTPTIIFFGTEDTNVPTSQGWMHYRALQQMGNTDVRFVLFPGEKHSPQKLVHQRRKLEEEMAWLDKYLFKTATDDPGILKPDSPLAVAIKLRAAMADGSRYGILKNGVLIPETVEHQGKHIGRFEVTRAQFAAFDANYKVEPGRENLPANNISFDQAQAYCRWLSQLTGETYRLMNDEEAEALYKASESPENTLDYWAGYSVNPDQARQLRSKIEKLEAGALLMPVGSFKGHGEGAVFDLGGNVGEWIVGRDGRGKIAGASADTPRDPKVGNRAPAYDYTGFRVLKDSGPRG